MFARQATYLRTVHEQGYPLFDGYEAYDGHLRRARAALTARPSRPCRATTTCGRKLRRRRGEAVADRLRVLRQQRRLLRARQPSTECDLDDDQVEALVTAYYGHTWRNKVARTRLQALVSAYGWSLWGAIQAAASSIDFDFEAWGRERFEKAARGFSHDLFPALLEDVQRDD